MCNEGGMDDMEEVSQWITHDCTCQIEHIEYHICPKKEELYFLRDDSDTDDDMMCNCCEACTRQCCMDI